MAVSVQRRKPRTRNVRSELAHWLKISDQAAQLTERKQEMRDKMMENLLQRGQEDDKGNFWLEFDEELPFVNYKGEKVTYTGIKNQLALVPANPQPDPELAEAVLEKHGLSISKEEQQLITRLVNQLGQRYKVIVEIDLESFGDMVFNGQITDEEYQTTLEEQKERPSFIPVKG